MSADEHLKTVELIYDAFRRGDVETILDQLTDDVDWAVDAESGIERWWGRRVGKGGVAKFFAQLDEAVIVEEFTPQAMATTETEVMSFIFMRMQSRKRELHGETLVHHYFRFRDGKVEYWRGSEDTLQSLDLVGPPPGPAPA